MNLKTFEKTAEDYAILTGRSSWLCSYGNRSSDGSPSVNLLKFKFFSHRTAALKESFLKIIILNALENHGSPRHQSDRQTVTRLKMQDGGRRVRDSPERETLNEIN